MCEGSSQVPGMMHAGYAANRMCLRIFSRAINNTPTGNYPFGVGGGLEINGSSQNPRRQHAGYAANCSRT